MGLMAIIRFIWNHPLNDGQRIRALMRFIRWQIGSRILHAPIVWPYVNDARLVISRGMSAATGNIYVGLMSFEEQAFLLHYLRSEDVFFDIGANVGTFTVLASQVIGAKSVAVEPDVESYTALMDNIFINRIQDRVKALNVAVGRSAGTVKFRVGLGSISHVLRDVETDDNYGVIPMLPLDEIAGSICPEVLKVDTEGYEQEVLAGAHTVLSNSALNVLMIELRGHGTRYGADEQAIDKGLRSLGFVACDYSPLTRSISIRTSSDLGDMLYIKDIQKARQRVTTAPKFLINGRMV